MAKIIGGTASTNMPVPDWEQTNPRKADYIKNKPTNLATTEYVDDAVAGSGGEKPWELLGDITLEEAVSVIEFGTALLRTKSELHIEGYIIPTDTTVTSQVVQFNNASPVWQTSVTCKATGKIYICMDIYKSPRGSTIYDGSISAYDYTLAGATLKMTKLPVGLADVDVEGLYLGNYLSLRTSSANPMAVGTRIKVWGR